jgi:hypothetical protein
VLLALFALTVPAKAAEPYRTALVSLCDPAKIATLTSDRAANPRVRKITYWLEVARLSGQSADAEMAATKKSQTSARTRLIPIQGWWT